MGQPGGTEFWKDMKPIAKVFKPDAAREAYIENAAHADERYFMPFTSTVLSRPLWICPSQNRWCDTVESPHFRSEIVPEPVPEPVPDSPVRSDHLNQHGYDTSSSRGRTRA